MFVSKIKYDKLVSEKAEMETEASAIKCVINDLSKKVQDQKETINELTTKLAVENSVNISGMSGGCVTVSQEDMGITTDLATGKTIFKKNGIKCIKITTTEHNYAYGEEPVFTSEIKEGFTEEKPDKGYNYKLIRE